MLAHGNLAQDLTHYCWVSEQIPSAVSLSIQFDAGGGVSGAGGMLLQVLPGAGEEVAETLERRVQGLPSLGAHFAAGGGAEEWVSEHFRGFSPHLLDSRGIAFHCPCSRDRIRNVLMLLPEDDLMDLRDNGPFPLEMRCHNCNTVYPFEAVEIEEICGLRRHRN
jgi:molecular chaperone Hsp33